MTPDVRLVIEGNISPVGVGVIDIVIVSVSAGIEDDVSPVDVGVVDIVIVSVSDENILTNNEYSVVMKLVNSYIVFCYTTVAEVDVFKKRDIH